MKMIKRSFGILLVAVLLLNLFGTTVSAAVMPDRAFTFRMRALESNVKAGETVTVVLNVESIEAARFVRAGVFDTGYDDRYFSLDVFNESVILEGYAYEGMIVKDLSKVDYKPQISPKDDEVSKYGWNKLATIALTPDLILHEDTWVDAAGEGGADIFAIKYNIDPSTPDGVYYLGLSYDGYDNWESYISEKNGGDAYNGFGLGPDTYGLSDDDILFDISEAVVAITVGDAAAEPVVTNNDVKVQWDNDASHIKLGYKATISDLELTTTFNSATNAYEVNELSEVGVLYSTTEANPTLEDVGSTAIKSICNTLYDNKDGTYSFRAIVKGAPIDNTTTIYSVMYITLADGTTSYYSISGATTPKAAFDAGRANGMPDFGA